MKYHKICNIPMNICTCEQKIAYNLAFAHAHIFRKAYNLSPMQFQKCEVIHEAVEFCMKMWGYNDKAYKYDTDAIFCALNAGIENYIANNCPILASYENIGEMFPAYYLKIC